MTLKILPGNHLIVSRYDVKCQILRDPGLRIERSIVRFFLAIPSSRGELLPHTTMISFKWFLVLVPVELQIKLNSRRNYKHIIYINA